MKHSAMMMAVLTLSLTGCKLTGGSTSGISSGGGGGGGGGSSSPSPSEETSETITLTSLDGATQYAYTGVSLTAKNAEGEEEWNHEFATDIQHRPTPGRYQDLYVITDDGVLTVLDETNGDIKFTYEDSEGFAFYATLNYQLPQLYLVTGDGYLDAVDVQTGDRLWRSNFDLEHLVPPSAQGNQRVIAHADKMLVAVNLDTGVEDWRVRVRSNLTFQATAGPNNLIYTVSGKRAEARRAADGELVWSKSFGINILARALIDSETNEVVFLVGLNQVRYTSSEEGLTRVQAEDN